MTASGGGDDRARSGGDSDRARFWRRGRAMQAIGLILVLLGALGLAVEAFGAALPVRIPPVVSGIVLVFGLLLMATSWRNEDEP